MPEQDWQATVLAELDLPRNGLVLPDSSGRSIVSSARPAQRRDMPSVGQAAASAPTQGTPAQSVAASPAAPSTPSTSGTPSVSSAPVVPSVPTAPSVAASPSAPVAEPWGQPRPAPALPDQRVVASDQPSGSPVNSAAPPPSVTDSAHDLEPPSTWEQSGESYWNQASQSSWDQVGQAPAGPGTSGPQAWGAPRQGEQRGPEQSDPAAWQGGAERPDAAGRPRAPEQLQSYTGPQQATQTPPSPGGPVGASELVRKAAHGDPLMRRVGRGVRKAMGASAAGEVRRTADVEAVLGRPVPSCRKIAVTSIRGGAGKTTVAGLTATVIAQYRQDRVLAVDADSGLGSLPLRLGVASERSLHELASAHPRSFEEATRYLAHTADGLWVLSGTAGGRIAGETDLATFQAAVGLMSRYFATMVVDCGAGLLPELQRGILAEAHAQVMVTPGTVDGALSVRGALEWQSRSGYGHLLTRTVVAFVTHTPHVDADLNRAAQMLSSGGMPVVHMPYDRHLAAGTAVESARIGQETRAAAIRIALEAFARATSV